MRNKVDEIDELMKAIERHGQSLEKSRKIKYRLDRIGMALEKAKINDSFFKLYKPLIVFFG
ncbi:hypothetical protein KHA80_18880 [Anaerobacillus sp. HL2]|nr:hypothetical protein KHA80_18880 [Anaerobacillus sp. HL2]